MLRIKYREIQRGVFQRQKYALCHAVNSARKGVLFVGKLRFEVCNTCIWYINKMATFAVYIGIPFSLHVAHQIHNSDRIRSTIRSIGRRIGWETECCAEEYLRALMENDDLRVCFFDRLRKNY